MVTELATGKSVGEANKISQQDVLNALGGLPEESQHCALLAANTLKAAVRDYLVLQKEPWKKLYRKY
jgi:nitrogen fixation NifU-like protein